MSEGLIRRLPDGTYRLPSLVDAHVHIESSHLTPREFGRAVARFGVLDAICDPHEIVNVMGEAGLEFMMADAQRSPARLHFALPSCVPSTPFETSGAEITAADTTRLLAAHQEIVALGEMMNVPGVLAGDAEVMAKITAAKAARKPIDGHFPCGSGAALKKYVSAGISSDHESVSADEAREKVACGMMVFIREGSSAKNLSEVLKAVDDSNWRSFCFCTDDISAADLDAGGGILDFVRKAVAMGIDPERAVAMASANPASHYGLELRPDDYVVVRDLRDFEVLRVVKGGNTLEVGEDIIANEFVNTVHIPELSGMKFAAPNAEADGWMDVIGVNEGSILTERIRRRADDTADLTLLTVIERHGKNGNVASAWTARTGLRRGVIASTVAHDHHNLIVLGNSAADIRAAAQRLERLGGGQCVVVDGEVLAELALPVAGLMSLSSARETAAKTSILLRAARETGCTLKDPFATLSFLALPVIPEIKLTDRGIFRC